MRLHRLTLTAFGSFPGEETVDFDALGEAGLFLIHGPTGAGKTTVLDAVCYALYGHVPGQRDNARRLRCDHAPAGTGPRVVLDVTVRGRRLRLTRSPVWQRPKRRGEGLIEEKAKVWAEELTPSGDWTTLSTRADETGDLVGGLLGMNADQFCQVAMLPQGDFARFLRADGDERRALLERLFAVKIFSQMERWLADHRTQTWREQQELRQAVDSVADRIRGAAGLPDPALDATGRDALDGTVPAASGHADAVRAPIAPDGAIPAASAGSALVPAQVAPDGAFRGGAVPDVSAREDPAAWARAVLAAADETLAEASESGTASEIVLKAARARLEDGRVLAARRHRHTEALARRSALDRTAEERADLEALLDESFRAGRVVPFVQRAEHRAETAAKARRLAADALSRAIPLLPPSVSPAVTAVPGSQQDEGRGHSPAGLVAGETGPEELAVLERGRLDEIARLDGLRAEEERWSVLRGELAQAEASVDELVSREAVVAGSLALLPGRRGEAERRWEAARRAAAGIPAAGAARDTASRVLVAVRRRDRLAADLAAAGDDLAEALAVALPGAEGGLAAGGDLANTHVLSGAGDGLAAAGDDLAQILAFPGADGHGSTAGAVREHLTGLERAVRDDLAALAPLRADEERADDLRVRLAGVETELADFADREVAARAAVAELPTRLTELGERLGALRAQTSALPAVQSACQAAHRLLETAELRDSLTAELAEAEQARVAATDLAQELRDRFLEARQARIDGMAGELAGGLVPGEPCVVCGSGDHPAPAAPTTVSVADDEAAAEARYLSAQDDRQSAESRSAALAARLQDAAATAGNTTREAARTAATSAENELVRLAALDDLATGLADEATRAEHALGEARERAAEVDRALAEIAARRFEVRSELDRLTRRLEAARGDDPTVQDRRDRLTTESAHLATAITAATRLAETAAAHEEARAAVPLLAARSPLPGSDAQEQTEAGAAGVLAEAEEMLAGLREAAAGEEEAGAEVARLAGEIAELERESREIDRELAASRTHRDQAGAEAERLRRRLDAARGEDRTLTARLERLADEAALLREAAETAGLARTAAAEAESTTAEAAEAAIDAGFGSAGEAQAAARPAEERAAMTERLRALDAEAAAVAGLLADPELVAAAAEPEPDLPALIEEHETAEGLHAGRTSLRDQALHRRGQLAELVAELDRRQAEWLPAEERHGVARQLAELAGGTSADNALDIRLSSYVLGERLRQVVDAANERLDHMSGGRYLLEYDIRKTAGSRKRSGGGLGLRVLDGWTGVDRDPATLSGGESFVTSLALALGLADVVTAEAGGAEIGTLFVDEGFGTLDEDTLDDVLDILDDLRDGGRAVGIVSHVAELRTRIPAQLSITKHRSGSTLSIRV
ncbi:AAA family ATPase [Streptosporangium soli]